MTTSLDSIIVDASDFISSEFNLKNSKSQLKVYSREDWEKFYRINKDSIIGLKREDEGLYTPIDYSAHIRTDTSLLISNIFHEFFGHGLFCEHSQIGKKLTDIIQKNQDANQFLYEEVNPNIQPSGLTRYNIHNHEGFAMWLESLLCEETGNNHVWESKKQMLNPNYLSLFEFFKDVEQKFTRFGFMSQLGFPKYYDNEKLINTLKKLYNGSFKDIDFILLYGSQKPESDIDLFIVSEDKSQNLFNGWLDIFQLSRVEFESWIDNLDISVTDPLFSGKLIHGDTNYYENSKQEVIQKPINEKQINHNLARAKKGLEYLSTPTYNSREEKIFLSYLKSYTLTAEELRKGNKVLTLQKINEIS